MDVYEIRKKNYGVLYDQFREMEMREGLPPRGALARFAAYCGTSAAFLSHVNNGRKPIGAEVARQIERAFVLPHGWMDIHHISGIDPENNRERQFAALALRMFREAPEDAKQEMLDRLKAQVAQLATT